jgi:hypothetical protein
MFILGTYEIKATTIYIDPLNGTTRMNVERVPDTFDAVVEVIGGEKFLPMDVVIIDGDKRIPFQVWEQDVNNLYILMGYVAKEIVNAIESIRQHTSHFTCRISYNNHWYGNKKYGHLYNALAASVLNEIPGLKVLSMVENYITVSYQYGER